MIKFKYSSVVKYLSLSILLLILFLLVSCTSSQPELQSTPPISSPSPTPFSTPVSEQSLPPPSLPQQSQEADTAPSAAANVSVSSSTPKLSTPKPSTETTTLPVPTGISVPTIPQPILASVNTTPPLEKPKSSPLSPQIRTTPAVTPSPLPVTAFDQFTGLSIDTTKYNTQINGNGSITQNDNIIIEGNSNHGISWVSLYTSKRYSLQEDYNLSVYVNLTGSVTQGSINAVLGLETLPILTSGKNPERGYCELSVSRNEKILRMSKTVGHLDAHIPLNGTLNLFWDKQKGKLTCTFNEQIITQYQDSQPDEYYGSLRAGLNSVSSGGGLETTGEGNYKIQFDNFYIQQN